jgi:hypothetical protein
MVRPPAAHPVTILSPLLFIKNFRSKHWHGSPECLLMFQPPAIRFTFQCFLITEISIKVSGSQHQSICCVKYVHSLFDANDCLVLLRLFLMRLKTFSSEVKVTIYSSYRRICPVHHSPNPHTRSSKSRHFFLTGDYNGQQRQRRTPRIHKP